MTRRRERESIGEIDEKERTVLDLGYKETNYLSRQMEIERTIPGNGRKVMPLDSTKDPDYPRNALT